MLDDSQAVMQGATISSVATAFGSKSAFPNQARRIQASRRPDRQERGGEAGRPKGLKIVIDQPSSNP
jgi:hypothetical protein